MGPHWWLTNAGHKSRHTVSAVVTGLFTPRVRKGREWVFIGWHVATCIRSTTDDLYWAKTRVQAEALLGAFPTEPPLFTSGLSWGHTINALLSGGEIWKAPPSFHPGTGYKQPHWLRGCSLLFLLGFQQPFSCTELKINDCSSGLLCWPLKFTLKLTLSSNI